MDARFPFALLLLSATAAVAAPPPATPPSTAAASAAAMPATTPAPMPDPLMAPDLRTLPGKRPSLVALVQQPAWQDPVIAAARAQFKQMPENCAAASFRPTGDLTLYAPAQFDAKGELVAGIWSEKVIETGCGTGPRQLNVLTMLQPGSAPARVPTMPGSTHADPTTQRNALQYAQAVAVRGSPPGCKQEVFTDTQFDGYTGLPNADITGGRDSRAWREVWLLSACGSDYVIGLTFTPNEKGIELSATNPVKRG